MLTNKRGRGMTSGLRFELNGFSTAAINFRHMSAIASFYIVPGERLTDVVAAATPAPGGWFRPERDTFWDALRGAARELETFAWSGWVFNTLDLYLESRHGFMYANFGDAVASRQLSKARGSDWLVMPAASAVELLAALSGVECDAGDVAAFISSEHGTDGAGEEAVAVQAALTTLKAWLAEVPPGSVGLLSVG